MVRRRSCAVSNHEVAVLPHPSRRGENAAPQDEDRAPNPGIKKADPRPAVFLKSSAWNWEPGRSEAPPGLEGYFFFDFLAFFAFFAFFAFLAIASSQG
jgi:hypothetical protein